MFSLYRVFWMDFLLFCTNTQRTFHNDPHTGVNRYSHPVVRNTCIFPGIRPGQAIHVYITLIHKLTQLLQLLVQRLKRQMTTLGRSGNS